MKFKDLKVGDKIDVNHSSMKAEVVYVNHLKKTTVVTFKLQSNFRLTGTFDSKSEVNI